MPSAIRSGRFIAAHPDCVFDRKPSIVLDTVVVHTMEGTLQGTIAFFAQGKDQRPVPTAAHYCVGREGDVVQMVPDEKKCYHAGNYNSRSIGIEHEVRIDPWPVRRNKDGSVKAPPFPAGEYPEAMLQASAEVVRVLCEKYGIPKDREHVIGHSEVPGATHRDPGPGWEWEAYMAMVRDAPPRMDS